MNPFLLQLLQLLGGQAANRNFSLGYNQGGISSPSLWSSMLSQLHGPDGNGGPASVNGQSTPNAMPQFTQPYQGILGPRTSDGQAQGISPWTQSLPSFQNILSGFQGPQGTASSNSGFNMTPAGSFGPPPTSQPVQNPYSFLNGGGWAGPGN